MEVHQEKIEMKTLSAVMNKLQADGYTANFIVQSGNLKVADKSTLYRPEQVKIDNFYRFEGESDPADMSILYAIETDDGIKGVISDAYGTYADPGVSKFIAAVEEISKKTDPSNLQEQK